MELVPDTTWWGADRPPAASPVCAMPGNLDSHGQASFGSAVVESDRHGTKAEPLDRFAARARRAYLRFDHRGHGLSNGRFDAGTIETRFEERIATIRDISAGPQILVGSSMVG